MLAISSAKLSAFFSMPSPRSKRTKSVIAIVVPFVLTIIAGKKKGDGQVAGLYLVCYSVGRFVLEFFRGDLERGNVGSLSTSQFIAIFTAIAGVVLFFWFGKKKAQGPEKNIQEEKVV